MSRPKRHLTRGSRAACGKRDPQLTTTSPTKVTCTMCLRSVHTADAIVKSNPKQSNQPF